MKELLEILLKALNAGRASMLVTIIAREGSSPRGVGAAMIVDADGTSGTVGGGAIEYQATLDARALLAKNASDTREYILHANEAADLGMICGGRVRMLLRFFAPDAENTALLERLLCWMREGEEAYLLCRIDGDGVGKSEGVLRSELNELPSMIREALTPPPKCPLLTEGETQVFIEPLLGAPRVIVFGGGHVSQQLVPLLGFLGYRAWVVEDRAEFANPALFPAAERTLLCSFESIAEAVTLAEADSVIVMTRGHQADYTILRQVLPCGADYIGCIGSRSKVAITRERLLADGFSEREIGRIHAPIGLSIGAETPAEIAVSVAAELVAHRAGVQSCERSRQGR